MTKGKSYKFSCKVSSQFIRLLAAEVCASAVVMLDTPCSEVVLRILATFSIRQFPLHFHARGSPCAITYEVESASTKPITMVARSKVWASAAGGSLMGLLVGITPCAWKSVVNIVCVLW